MSDSKQHLEHDTDCQFQMWCSCGAYTRQQEALTGLFEQLEVLRQERDEWMMTAQTWSDGCKRAEAEVARLRQHIRDHWAPSQAEEILARAALTEEGT